MQVIVRTGAAWGRIGRWALTAAVMAGACTPLAADDDTWLSEPPSDVEEAMLVVAPVVCEDDPPPAPLADAHPDLEIELEDVGPALLEPGDVPQLRATLVNRS